MKASSELPARSCRRSTAVLWSLWWLFGCSVPLVWAQDRPVQSASDRSALADLDPLLRGCLRAARQPDRPDPFGLIRIDLTQDCPTLWAALAVAAVPLGGRERLLPTGSSTTLRQLEELTRIVESAAGPAVSMRLLPAARLGQILADLDPAARGELSTRARLARWWRSVVGEFDPRRSDQRSAKARIQWPLGFWSTVSWFAFGTAALLILTVVVQEIRAVFGSRRTRRTRPRDAVVPAAPDVDLAALAALPPRRRAGELLRIVAARLHGRGSLPPPVPLTPREIGGLARLTDAERASLALVTEAGEVGAYGRQPPAEAQLVGAAEAASQWLVTPRPWWLMGERR
jgi:hypothetical protein